MEAKMLPKETMFVVAEPVKAEGVALAFVVVLEEAVEVAMARVVWVAETVAIVFEATGAAVPVTRTTAAEVAPAAVALVKTTWGTVTAVETTITVEEDGMALPEREPVDSVHGTVRVV